MINLNDLPPAACLAVADYFAMQARELHARYGQYRRSMEDRVAARDGLRKAAARQDAFMAEVAQIYATIEQKRVAAGEPSAPGWSRREKSRLDKSLKQAVAAAAIKFEMRPADAWMLFEATRRRQGKLDRLRRDLAIMRAVAGGDPVYHELGQAHGMTAQHAKRLVQSRLDAAEGNADRAISMIEQELAAFEPRTDEPGPAPDMPRRSAFEGDDGVRTDEPLLRIWRRYDAAVDRHASLVHTSGSYLASRAALEQEIAESWRMMVTTPAVSAVGIAVKLKVLDDCGIPDDSDFSDTSRALFRSVITDAMRVAGPIDFSAAPQAAPADRPLLRLVEG